MLNGFHIVLVEDDEIMGMSLLQRLELEGASVQWFKQSRLALGALRTPRVPVDAVICDIRLPDGDGETLFNTLCQSTSPPPFLFVTGHGGVEQAVRLMQGGAADYVTKPFEMPVFLDRLSLLLNSQSDDDSAPLIGVSPAAKRVDELATLAAITDRPILIRGGPGTGRRRGRGPRRASCPCRRGLRSAISRDGGGDQRGDRQGERGRHSSHRFSPGIGARSARVH